ncbi:MAG: eight-cysteine-cluster domain-containing protein [Candidatus Aenigmatarchaeota archaeon]
MKIITHRIIRLFILFVIIIAGLILLFYQEIFKNEINNSTLEEFCGFSTDGNCYFDSDCILGGCSGQICQSKNEESIVTTCEFRECYDAEKYNLKCKCINLKCQWSK